jgi:hypothetical protein
MHVVGAIITYLKVNGIQKIMPLRTVKNKKKLTATVIATTFQ